MPTLLELADLPVPETCDGMSAIASERRPWLYGEVLENHSASRMLYDGRYKLIWYPAGNRIQLFYLENDPGETVDLAVAPSHVEIRDRLAGLLADQCYGKDLEVGWGAGRGTQRL